MSEKLKPIFIQMLMITTGIVAVMSVEGIAGYLKGEAYSLMWYHPVSILAAAVLCSLPSLLFSGYEKWSKNKFIVCVVIHAIILYIIIVGMGYVFTWYKNLPEWIFVTAAYVLIYVFVWVGSLWIGKRDANEINEALNGIRDEE